MFFCMDELQFAQAKITRDCYDRCENNEYLDAAVLLRSKDKEEVETAATKLQMVPELGAYRWKYLLKVKLNLESLEELGPNT